MTAGQVAVAAVVILGFLSVLFGLVVLVACLVNDHLEARARRRAQRHATADRAPAPVYALAFYRARRDRPRRPAA